MVDLIKMETDACHLRVETLIFIPILILIFIPLPFLFCNP